MIPSRKAQMRTIKDVRREELAAKLYPPFLSVAFIVVLLVGAACSFCAITAQYETYNKLLVPALVVGVLIWILRKLTRARDKQFAKTWLK